MVIVEVGDAENTTGSRGMAGAGHTKANVNSSRKSGKTATVSMMLYSIVYSVGLPMSEDTKYRYTGVYASLGEN